MNFLGLFSSKKYLGRREFFINYLIVQVFILIFSSIYNFIFFALTFISENITLSRAISDEATVGICTFIEFLLLQNSINKRVSDIIGEDYQNKVWIVSFICNIFITCIFRYFSLLFQQFYYKPGFLTLIMFLICIAIFAILFFKPGKLSSVETKNPDIRFNWGAFWGTWIWGIINKIWTPVFTLPLMIINPTTIICIPILCGLKGNEWIIAQNKNENIENLHQKQKRQAWILFFLIPIIVICLLFTVSKVLNYGNNYDILLEKLNKVNSYVIQKDAKFAFQKIEYSEGEYKFYIKTDEFNSPTEKNLLDIYQLAIYKVLDDKNIQYTKTIPVEVINKTVILDSSNNMKLLHCQIPKEYGDSVPTKQDEFYKVIRQYSK